MKPRHDLGLEDPSRFEDALNRCARGDLPPNVTVMHLAVEARDAHEAEAALERAIASLVGRSGDETAADRLQQALAIWHANPQAFGTVKAVLRDVEHQGPAEADGDPVAHWTAVFDRIAREAPEASVALYALGNPDLLRATTAEVVARMQEWGLLGPDRAVLEIGCGIGRFQEALAAEAGLVVGIDISPEMIEAGQRRCASLGNVRLHVTSGRDLSLFEDASFDLVFAVDSFPYLVQAGMALAARHVEEAARVLRPGGDLLILNFSYGRDPEADRGDLARLAADFRFNELRTGTREFHLWDGRAFQLKKTS